MLEEIGNDNKSKVENLLEDYDTEFISENPLDDADDIGHEQSDH